MRIFSLFLTLLLEQVSASTFVDDLGQTHSIPDNPTIVAGAMDAVALSHFGNAIRVIATVGERSSSGSNYGGTYYDGNLAFAELNHDASPYNPDIFPSDPNDIEREFLNNIPGDLSAECSSSNYYCDKVDLSYLNENGWPDVIILGSFYNSLQTDDLKGNATEKNIPIIIMTDTYGNVGGESTLPRDMIQMVERFEELALAVGINNEASIKEDKKLLCEASNVFKTASKSAHEKGVRSMAVFLPYRNNPQGMTGGFINNPDLDPVLSMMQNLGLPIVYHETIDEYYENRAGGYMDDQGDMNAVDLKSPSGIPYPVDFWLYDDRVALDFISEDFQNHWPHPAILEKQYAPFPSNAKIFSYKHATEILLIVADQLAKANRIVPESTCTNMDDTLPGSVSRNLGAGEFSCFKTVPISFCEEKPMVAKTSGIEDEKSQIDTPEMADKKLQMDTPEMEDEEKESSGFIVSYTGVFAVFLYAFFGIYGLL